MNDAPSDKSPNPPPLTVQVAETDDKRLAELEQSEQTQADIAQTLKRMGLTKRMTKRVFAGRTDGKILRRQVCGQISLVFFANTLDNLALIQRKTLMLARRQGIEPRDICAALSVGVQAGNSIANLGMVFMDAAGELDRETPKTPKPPTVVQQFNIGQGASPASLPLPPAISGDTQRAP